ncbi:MAG TPA: hypothetical protein VFV71_10405 [Burkholderiales bacterium]|nr:hypothetical protein [Burkholderiales bacterium]
MSDEPRPQHTPIFGNAEFEAAVDTVIRNASGRIRIFDQTLGRGYNSPQRCELIRAFLLAGRRNALQIVLHDVQPLDRNCPRVLGLLRTHGHGISINETHQNAKSVYDPFIIVDDRHFVHRFHFDEMRGLLGLDDPIGTNAFIERFAEIWEASSPAASATTLGL